MFNIEERKAIASRLLDKEIAEGIFERIRNRIIEQHGKGKYAAEQAKGDHLLEILARQQINYLNDYNFLIDIIEAIALNSIRDHEFLLKLADAHLKSDSQKNAELQNIRDQLMEQKSETEKIAKLKDTIRWVDEYLKRSSQTTTE